MASNEEIIRERYRDTQKEEGRFLRDRASGMEALYTKRVLSETVPPDARVLEIGCGPGYYGLFLAERCRVYLGVDLSPDTIETFLAKIQEQGLKNVEARVGDATNLNFIPDRAFDVVLVLGPMYHLPPAERELVFRESRRVCRDGGVIIYAYINKVGAYLAACLQSPEVYPTLAVNECVLEQGINDICPEMWFFTMPEDMEQAAARHGLRVLRNVGVNFALHAGQINAMPEEQWQAYLGLADCMHQSPSCTGVSAHALLVCQNGKPAAHGTLSYDLP